MNGWLHISAEEGEYDHHEDSPGDGPKEAEHRLPIVGLNVPPDKKRNLPIGLQLTHVHRNPAFVRRMTVRSSSMASVRQQRYSQPSSTWESIPRAQSLPLGNGHGVLTIVVK